MVSEVQSVHFKKSSWTSAQARVWLKEHGYKPIKRGESTKNYLSYRLHDPKRYKRIRTKATGKDIQLVIGFLV